MTVIRNYPYWRIWDYGLTSSYGSTVNAIQSPFWGNTNFSVTYELAGLEPNNTYHYRVIASNIAGTTYGADTFFVTLSQLPYAVTNYPNQITTHSVLLNGTINPYNSLTTVTFEYGLTQYYTNTITATQSPISGIGNTIVSYPLTGLISNKSYHYRVVAQNIAGINYGDDIVFTTAFDGIEDFKNSKQILLQNVPNPFYNSTIIKYTVTTKGYVSLKVFDIKGNEMSTLVDDIKEVGSYSVLFNASTIKAGIYFYQLKSGKMVKAKKMIKI